MKKKSKLEKFVPILLGTCMLTLIAACGSDDDDDNGVVATPQQEEEVQQEGQYRVVLSPVNPNVAGDATGSGSFNIEGDEFQADLQVTGAPIANHPQFIYVGDTCPTPASDTNGDGYIDAQEAAAVAGGQLVPLDSDLRSQEAGGRYRRGQRYDYEQTTSFQSLLNDLRQPDEDPNDFLVKLGADENLNLEGKVLIVHGISVRTALPATVSGLGQLSPQQALPILCGPITRETPAPEETPTPEETPAPEGETGTTGSEEESETETDPETESETETATTGDGEL